MHELPGLCIYKEYLKNIIAVAFSTVYEHARGGS